MKQCTKCKEWKDESEFYKDKQKSDGLYSHCKECKSKLCKVVYFNKREEYLQKQREYQKNNKNVRQKWMKENKDHWNKYHRNYYHSKNKDNIKQKTYSPIKFLNVHSNKIKLYEETRKSKNGNLECKCAYCGCWFEPYRLQIKYRLDAIEGKCRTPGSEFRLYCSQSCKNNCSIYRQTQYPKGYKPATSREVQPELRQLVFERDNYTCQKCNKHKDELEKGLHCHHKYPLNENPVESADIDSCITLCEDCHKWIHMNVAGCGYGEMRCSK